MTLHNARLALAAAAALAFLPVAASSLAADPDPKTYHQILADRPVTQETLLDRINIQDFLTRYYYDLSVGKAHELAEYFTEDGVLDVDGTVARGLKEIAKLYERPPRPPVTKANYRRGNMILSNPIINVEGNIATAHLLWTGVMNEGVGKEPSIYEQGREYTELKKVNGKWLISRRFITSDSGRPDKFDATWYPREHR